MPQQSTPANGSAHATRVVHCKCGAEMVWARTREGKRMPLNYPPEQLGEQPHSGSLLPPNVAGKFVIVACRDSFVAVGLSAVSGRLPVDTMVFTSHFATCKHADEFRRDASRGVRAFK